jgi:hypothetical protein
MLDEYEVLLYALWIDLHKFPAEKAKFKTELMIIGISLKFSLYSDLSMDNFQYSQILNSFLQSEHMDVMFIYN